MPGEELGRFALNTMRESAFYWGDIAIRMPGGLRWRVSISLVFPRGRKSFRVGGAIVPRAGNVTAHRGYARQRSHMSVVTVPVHEPIEFRTCS